MLKKTKGKIMAFYSTKSDSNIFKKCRVASKMSQKEAASILNVVPSTLSKWETGVATPDQTILPKIADLYNVSVDYLLGRDAPTPAPTDNTITAERLRALGIDTDGLDNLSDEQLSVIRTTLSALLDSFKKSNK